MACLTAAPAVAGAVPREGGADPREGGVVPLVEGTGMTRLAAVGALPEGGAGPGPAAWEHQPSHPEPEVAGSLVVVAAARAVEAAPPA